MQRSNKVLLKIAVERGYLPVDVARRVLRATKERQCSAERVICDGQILSERRMARLNTHYRYRSMRKADKLYGMLTIRKNLLTKKQVLKSLKAQKTAFETRRECMRLGNLLIERGLLTAGQDRALRAQAAGKALPSEVVRAVSDIPSSAATLAIHEGSKLGIDVAGTTNSYNMITDAVARVDAIREIQATLSTSENVGTDGTPAKRVDSANEIESALTMLARQRLGFEPPKPKPARKKKRKPAKRTTGLMAIFRLTAQSA
jgi:hypothetical protein